MQLGNRGLKSEPRPACVGICPGRLRLMARPHEHGPADVGQNVSKVGRGSRRAWEGPDTCSDHSDAPRRLVIDPGPWRRRTLQCRLMPWTLSGDPNPKPRGANRQLPAGHVGGRPGPQVRRIALSSSRRLSIWGKGGRRRGTPKASASGRARRLAASSPGARRQADHHRDLERGERPPLSTRSVAPSGLSNVPGG